MNMKEKEIRKFFNVKRTKHGLEARISGCFVWFWATSSPYRKIVDRISVSSGWTFPFNSSKLPEGYKTAKAIHILTKLPVHFSGNNISKLIN